jgi:FkbM family methyltransferase
MKLLFPSVYQLKRALLYPRTMYMRRQHADRSGFMKAMMELHYYRPSLFNFIGATVYDKHILHEADIGPGSVVIDVGAYTGAWAQHMVDRYDPTIYAFEPNPESFAVLQEKATNNPKLKPMPYGLGSEDMSVEFTANGLGSSMYEEREKNANVPRIRVEIAAIDRIWKELELGQVDLMKINIEGAEFPLLDKMIEENLLSCVHCFLIQFHEWHPGAHWKRWRIRKELRKTHRLVWDFHFIWEKWEKI